MSLNFVGKLLYRSLADLSPDKMLDGKVKHDWYQTETHVVIEVRIKGLKPETVKVDFEESTLSLSAPLPDVSGSEYCLDLDLAHPVNDILHFHSFLDQLFIHLLSVHL